MNGEQVAATLAAAWHAKGFTGKGVKVAIIDGGFRGLAERQALGDPPGDVVTQDLCHGGLTTADDHGTAVAEIVHEMAPDAQLYLICVETDVDFAAAVGYAKSEGVHVINHSAGWEGPFRNDGNDRFSAIVADATASGILWVNSAGNEATRTGWAATPRTGLAMWNPNGDMGNSFIWPNGTVICGFLKWDEWPSGISDFDLGLFLSGSNSLARESPRAIRARRRPAAVRSHVRRADERTSTSSSSGPFGAIASRPRRDSTSSAGALRSSTRVAAGSIATGFLARGPRRRRAVLAVAGSSSRTAPRVRRSTVGRSPTSSGTTACRERHTDGSPRARPPSQGRPHPLRRWRVRRHSSSRRTRGSDADQIKTYSCEVRRDLGAAGVDNVYGAGELQLPTPPDIVAPTISALASTGRTGRVIRLLSRVSDDSGQVRA